MSQADRLRMLAGKLLQRDALVARAARRLPAGAAGRAARARGERVALLPRGVRRRPGGDAVRAAAHAVQAGADGAVGPDRVRSPPPARRRRGPRGGPQAGEPYLGEYQVFSTSGASGLRGLFVYGAPDWAALSPTPCARSPATARDPGSARSGSGRRPGSTCPRASSRPPVRRRRAGAVGADAARRDGGGAQCLPARGAARLSDRRDAARGRAADGPARRSRRACSRSARSR